MEWGKYIEKHDEHEVEQLQVLPRQLVDEIEDFDEVFKLYVDKKQNKSPQDIYELRKKFEDNLNEFLHYIAEKIPADALLEVECRDFPAMANKMSSMIESYLKKKQLDEADIIEWDIAQEEFCDKVQKLRKMLTNENGPTPPPPSLN